MPNAPSQYRPRGWQPARQVRDQQASASERGYDHTWLKVRLAYRAQHPVCEDCLTKGMGPRQGERFEVDHIIPFKGTDDPLRLDMDNLRTRCRPCHAVKTQKDDEIRRHYELNGRDATLARYREATK